MQFISEEQRVEFSATLLSTLKSRQSELTELLAKCSGEWPYEIGVYYFYHGSFKVIRLMRVTEEIVEALRSLCPERELNEWFMEIIHDGTRRGPQLSDSNEAWSPSPRQILEAFFHARFLLEMAVRYASLEEPRYRPVGLEALLYLYRM